MTQHRRSHVTEAIAQIQNEQSLLVDGAAATNVMPVPGIKVGDNLVSVTNVSVAPPVAYGLGLPDDYVIYEPQAVAKLDLDAGAPGAAFALDSYVEIGGLKFIFSDRTGGLVEDNYPVGSNSSNRYYVPFSGVAATDLTSLVAAINVAYQTPAGGALAGVVASEDVLDLVITAVAYGAAGEVVTVVASTDLTDDGAEWQDAASAATDVLQVAAGDVEGIIAAVEDSSGAGAGGVEVIWQPYQNNDTIDNPILADANSSPAHVGDYGPGDGPYDSAAGDPGNVGHGPGRLPPGWTP